MSKNPPMFTLHITPPTDNSHVPSSSSSSTTAAAAKLAPISPSDGENLKNSELKLVVDQNSDENCKNSRFLDFNCKNSRFLYLPSPILDEDSVLDPFLLSLNSSPASPDPTTGPTFQWRRRRSTFSRSHRRRKILEVNFLEGA